MSTYPDKTFAAWLLAVSFIFTALLFSFSLNAQQSGNPSNNTKKELILFGRGTYPGDDSTFAMMAHSGFTTLLLSSFYIKSNGDLYSGDDGHHPVIHNGQFTGSEEWIKRIAALKKDPKSSIKRVEILLEGRWYNQAPNTYDFLQDWIDSSKGAPGVVVGTAPGSTLYQMMKILKEKVGADAICIDDESVYDSPSIIRLGEMVHGLGLHMTLCPYTKIPFWRQIMDSSRKDLIDAVYIQCYDGGKDNTMAPWANGLPKETPVYPIFLCRGAFSTCEINHNSKSPAEISTQMQSFRKEYPGMRGAGVWQMADIKSYVQMKCAVTSPASGTAASVPEYLSQLKKSLSE